MAEPYDVILKTLVDNGYLTLPDKPGNWDPPNKPDWWREDHYCHYHRNKGHPTDNCFRLKDDIQDLIENGTISTDGLTKNSDHTAFKDPLPKHDKGETSQTHKKNHDAKINYTYPSNTPVINMVEPVESVLMMRSQDDNKVNHGKPKLVLQTRGSSSSRSETLNAVTRGQAKIVLKTAQDPKQA
ncbi:hypothetical protein, partial [[Clostridium] innocuum]|uniref:hypothetical protein n=1 Tax=Clostridium innocuum TaxID=1522 RepID=UPI0005D20BB7